MNLYALYQQAVNNNRFESDPAQLIALEQLHILRTQLESRLGDKQRPLKEKSSLFWIQSQFQRMFRSTLPPQRGLYIWGGVGRGKTWLMDMFFETLPFKEKLRLHFRHFMQEIHDELAQLTGHRDPLPIVAQRYSQRTRILCLDEFYVEDISDAMILYRLLEALTAHGIVLVFTSNLAPHSLYLNGLQRERFLPAIELITRGNEVIEITGSTDHRLRKLKQARTYYYPLNTDSEHAIEQRFSELAPCTATTDTALDINHRQIHCLRRADDIVWFDFYQLCHGPRASADYIELARQFHTVFISNVPCMEEHEEDWVHRFINLVDEFYDRRVKLLITADNEPKYLYRGRRHKFDFQRTVSRLMEMRSNDYLALAHRP